MKQVDKELKKEDYIRVLEKFLSLYNQEKANYEKQIIECKDTMIESKIYESAFEGYPENLVKTTHDKYINDILNMNHNISHKESELKNIAHTYNRLLSIINNKFGLIEDYNILEVD